jgi:putative restriction endonuclease
MATNHWTRDQTIIALAVYCKIPFNRVSSSHPLILKYSKIIGRSTNALKMKIGNFGSFDPELKKRGIVGLSNTSQLDQQIWSEFENNWEELAIQSELLIATLSNVSIEQSLEIDIINFPEGRDREAIVKTRVNQSFFRSAILSSYDSTCCITGLSVPDLLIASHIIPWRMNAKERTNPRNGLCLNSLHDKAFDKGYISVTPDYEIKVSKIFSEKSNESIINDYFIKYKNTKIRLPERFMPKKEYLDYHFNNIFLK